MSSQTVSEIQWYVMLFPEERESHPVVQQMANLVGGTSNPDLHVTLGYFVPHDPAADLAAPLRDLRGPTVPITASQPFNGLWRRETPAVARNILLQVEPTPELRQCHAAINAVLATLAVATWPNWDDVQLHMHAVMEPTIDPPEALALLSRRQWQVAFVAQRLVVSRRQGETITVLLDQPFTSRG